MIEQKLLQMANVYMAKADFDDTDEWFNDDTDDEPVNQEVNVEVRTVTSDQLLDCPSKFPSYSL